MPYSILTEIGGRYKSEAGKESAERFEVFEGSAQSLRVHIALAEVLKLEALYGKNVASDLPKIGLRGERVKALVHFHENTAKRWFYISKVNAEVAHMRKWLSWQGAVLTPDGDVVWSKSTRKVEYDSTLQAQGLTKIRFQDGLMYLGDKLFDTGKMVTHFSGPYHCIYVMSKEGNFHVSSHAVGYRHHSSLLNGQHVAGAGEMRVHQGRIVYLSNKSGHYKPDLNHLFQTLAELQKQNVLMDFRIKTFQREQPFESVQAFFEYFQADNESYQAHQVLKSVEKDVMSYFLQDHNMAFLTPAANPEVNTPGFHRLEEGRPPYWISPEEARQKMISYDVPMNSAYVKSGAGR